MKQGNWLTWPNKILNWRWTWVIALITLLFALYQSGHIINNFVAKPRNSDFYTFYLTSVSYAKQKPLYKLMHLKLPVGTRYVRNKQGKLVKQIGLIDIYKLNFNPPFFTWLMLPFAKVSYVNGFIIFDCLSILLGLLGSWFVAAALFKENNVAKYLFFAAIALFFKPTVQTLEIGQLGLIIYFFLALACYLFVRGHRQSAALVLGVLAAIKLFVLLFLPYFLLQRQWRLLALFLATFLVMSFLPLFEFKWQVYQNYYQLLRAGPGLQRILIVMNGSILSFFLRLGVHNLNELGKIPRLFFDMAFALGIILAVYYFYAVRRRFGDSSKFLFHLSLTIVTMFLISPLGWSYYYTALLFVFFYTWSRLIQLKITPFLCLPFFLAAMVLMQYYPLRFHGFVPFAVLSVTLSLLLVARYSTVTDLAKLRG